MARRKISKTIENKEGEEATMTIEEAKEALEELKKEGNSEEDILKILYVMYQDDAITLSDLRSFTELLGYKFTEEFEAMSDEDKKTKGVKKAEDDQPAEGVDKEDIEKAKEFGDDADEKKAKAESKEDEDEEDDDAKAARLFGFKK